MATKKPASKPKSKPKTQLQNLAARPQGLDDTVDEQLVDHSGVFRVTSAITQAQTGRDEASMLRFASDSLVMQAQRDTVRDDGPTIDEAVEDNVIDDETVKAEKRQRLATLAARNQLRRRR
jgi:hypothetical protein